MKHFQKNFRNKMLSRREPVLQNGSLENSSFADFEDCVQSGCAGEVNADCIITRNAKDFAVSKIAALSPEEFLSKTTE